VLEQHNQSMHHQEHNGFFSPLLEVCRKSKWSFSNDRSFNFMPQVTFLVILACYTALNAGQYVIS
jgi:hypothetical protein